MENLQVELEHTIGFSSSIPQSVIQHPTDPKSYIYIGGSVIIINDIEDSHNQKFLRGHDNTISSFTLSNNGNYIATGQFGENADIYLWDYNKMLFRFEEHEKGVDSLSFSHDSKLLASIGNSIDRRLLIWNVETGDLVAGCALPKTTIAENKILVSFGGMVRDIKRRETDKYLLATCSSSQIILWSLDPFKGILEYEKVNIGSFIREYTCIQFDLFGEYLYLGSTSGDLSFVQVKHKRLFSNPLKICSSGVLSLCNTQDNKLLIGGGDGTLSLFDGENVIKKSKISKCGGIISLSKFSNEFIICGTDIGEIYKINNNDFNDFKIISRNHSKEILAIDFPYQVSDKFATISKGSDVLYWDINNYFPETECKLTNNNNGLLNNNNYPTCCSFIKNDISILLIGMMDGSIRAVDCENGELLWILPNAHRNAVTRISTSYNNKFIVSGGQEGDIRIYSLSSRQLVCTFKEHSSFITEIIIMKDDVHVLSSCKDKTIFCWDLRNERRVAAFIHKVGTVNGFILGNDQETIISIGSDRNVTFWDIGSDTPFKVICYSKKYEPKCITKSNLDDSLFAIFGNDGFINIYSFKNGELLISLNCEGQYFNQLKFSPDDKQLIAVGENHILLFNVYL
ncbi:hypothetical protein ABK040_001028 [Willaertia magna]